MSSLIATFFFPIVRDDFALYGLERKAACGLGARRTGWKESRWRAEGVEVNMAEGCAYLP